LFNPFNAKIDEQEAQANETLKLGVGTQARYFWAQDKSAENNKNWIS
jgi:hypothetical protein